MALIAVFFSNMEISNGYIKYFLILLHFGNHKLVLGTINR